MVGFWDLVGTGIAPVSKETAVNVKEKEILLRLSIIFIGPDCGYFDCNINFTKKK